MGSFYIFSGNLYFWNLQWLIHNMMRETNNNFRDKHFSSFLNERLLSYRTSVSFLSKQLKIKNTAWPQEKILILMTVVRCVCSNLKNDPLNLNYRKHRPVTIAIEILWITHIYSLLHIFFQLLSFIFIISFYSFIVSINLTYTKTGLIVW